MAGNIQYFFADSGSAGIVKAKKPNLPECFSKWVKVPKGSTNIHFEIPYYEVSRQEKKTHEDAGETPIEVRDALWPVMIPTQLRDLLDSTAASEGEESPPLYAYDVWGADESKLACLFFCRSHAASIQVFHTNGKLLTGTPLTNWATCIDDNRFDECNGYVGGMFSPKVTAEGEAIWKKCGIWAEWYSAVTASESASTAQTLPDVITSLPPTGTVVSTSDLSTKLRNHYPAIFSSSFSFDDSQVNGNQSEVLKVDDITVQTFTVDGETIQWTGSIGGATGIGAVDHRAQQLSRYNLVYVGETGLITHTSSPYEKLDIAEAKEDLIIGFLSSDGVAGWGRWYEPEEGENIPEPAPAIPIFPDIPEPIQPDFDNRPVYRNFQNLAPIYRGDDMVIHKPYAGVAGFRDGRYIVASRERGKLAMMTPDGRVICTADPLARRLHADRTICYGIALHVSEKTLYMLVGEEGSAELYVTRVEIMPVPLSTMPEDIHIHDGTPKPNAESVFGAIL